MGTHPTDISLTPPISPAMQCVMNLTLQYFTFNFYLVLFISITVKQLGYIMSIFERARTMVLFAPMLSLLFTGMRMRALQLTKATDGITPTTAGPQTWVQDAMLLATWSVLVQLITIFECATAIFITELKAV